MTEQPTDLDTDDLYRIGTVAKLTGVSVECLRAWERRYGLAPSHRAGKIRFYSRDQVERLRRIRELTDSGQAISTVIDLSDEQLSARLATHAPPTDAQPAQTARTGAGEQRASVGLVGTNLLLLDTSSDTESLQLSGRWASLDELRSETLDLSDLDALVVQVGHVNQRSIEAFANDFPDNCLIVLYQYALPGFAAEVPAGRVQPMRVAPWSGQWRDVVELTRSALNARSTAHQLEARHFTDTELIGIASSLDSDTGVPGHVVDLVTRLNALSDFAVDCQRSARDGEVADAHAVLADAAAAASTARALLEQTLERWMEHDQLEPDSWHGD